MAEQPKDDDRDPADDGAPIDLSEELIRKWNPDRLSKTIANKAGKQRKLDAVEQSRYERRFGVDLSRVRIVTGAFAEEFTSKHNAEAVTVGSTGMVLMRQSQEFMGGARHESLLAHELTHVAQAMPGVHRKNVNAATPDSSEGEAEAAAHEQMVLAQEMGGGAGHEDGGGDHNHNPSKQNEDEHERKEKLLALVLEMLEDDARVLGIRLGAPGPVY